MLRQSIFKRNKVPFKNPGDIFSEGAGRAQILNYPLSLGLDQCSATSTPTPSPKDSAPTFVSFPFFLQSSFWRICRHPPPASPRSLGPSLFCPFPNKMRFVGAEAAGDPKVCGVGTILSRILAPRPGPHLLVAGSISSPVTEGRTMPWRGSGKKRTTVTLPRRAQVGLNRDKRSAAHRPGCGRPSVEDAARGGPGWAPGRWTHRGQRPQEMTQRSPRTRVVPHVLTPSPQGTSRQTCCVSASPVVGWRSSCRRTPPCGAL
jgi:hypothetical protein